MGGGFFLGGYADKGNPFLDRADAVDTAAWKTQAVVRLPDGRGGLGAAVARGRVFAFGGSTLGKGLASAWDPRADTWELVP